MTSTSCRITARLPRRRNRDLCGGQRLERWIFEQFLSSSGRGPPGGPEHVEKRWSGRDARTPFCSSRCVRRILVEIVEECGGRRAGAAPGDPRPARIPSDASAALSPDELRTARRSIARGAGPTEVPVRRRGSLAVIRQDVEVIPVLGHPPQHAPEVVERAVNQAERPHRPPAPGPKAWAATS